MRLVFGHKWNSFFHSIYLLQISASHIFSKSANILLFLQTIFINLEEEHHRSQVYYVLIGLSFVNLWFCWPKTCLGICLKVCSWWVSQDNLWLKPATNLVRFLKFFIQVVKQKFVEKEEVNVVSGWAEKEIMGGMRMTKRKKRRWACGRWWWCCVWVLSSVEYIHFIS